MYEGAGWQFDSCFFFSGEFAISAGNAVFMSYVNLFWSDKVYIQRSSKCPILDSPLILYSDLRPRSKQKPSKKFAHKTSSFVKCIPQSILLE